VPGYTEIDEDRRDMVDRALVERLIKYGFKREGKGLMQGQEKIFLTRWCFGTGVQLLCPS